MREWEYRKLDLNDLPRKRTDIDVLCDAGRDGWELVSVNANSMAYLKREIVVSAPPTAVAKARKVERAKA